MVAQLVSGTRASSTQVMLVDDSAIVRGVMRRWIGAEPRLQIVGSATNGQEAIDVAQRTHPDIIILDLEMPIMDGLEALPRLRQTVPKAKILISSTLTTRNAQSSLAAMRKGATDYLAKPDAGASKEDFRVELIEKLRALSQHIDAQAQPLNSSVLSGASSRAWQGHMAALAIGASTGGPQALNAVFSALAGQLDECAVFVTQHMPPQFTQVLGEELAQVARLKGGEAVDGAPVEKGTLYLAPGGRHMRVTSAQKGAVIELGDDAPINFCKPAVDPLFETIAQHFGENCVGLVLTGMGSDGAAGVKKISASGGFIIAQDQMSSVVWGMPGAAVATGVVKCLLPLDAIGPQILNIKGRC